MDKIFPFERNHLGSHHVFDGLDENTFAQLNKRKAFLRFKKGEVIFKENTFPSCLFIVKKGKVKKYTDGYDGVPHIFYICKEEEFLGYHAILSEEPYADSAAALTDCEIEMIPKEDFVKAVYGDPILEKNLLKNLAHEFGYFITRSKILGQLSVRQRVAVSLLFLEDKFITPKGTKESIAIGREDFASFVGTAKETLVRILHDFKEEQLITSEGRKLIVKNQEGLLNIAKFI